tara:strand:- start:336 stop:569 length:234 start_codon:yes stop_codon:yes gene_type:complete
MAFKLKGSTFYGKSPLKHPAEESNLKGHKKGLRHVHNKDKDGKVLRSWKWIAKNVPKDYEDKAKPHRNTPKSPFNQT